MAKIKKTKVDGALVYPATIFPAVKDPNTGQTLTEKLSELGQEASIDKSVLSSLQYKYIASDAYVGFFCGNVNTGLLYNADSTGNGIVLKVKEGETYKITGGNLKYGNSSIQFYSGFPSLETNVKNEYIRRNAVTIPSGVTHMLISVNPSLGTETLIENLGWINKRALPEGVDTVVENLGSIYKADYYTITKGVAGGQNTSYSASLVGLGDTIEVFVKSDTIESFYLLSNNGKWLGSSFETNKKHTYIVSSADSEFLATAESFGFYIKTDQAIADGYVNCELRIIKNDTFSESTKLLEAHNNVKEVSRIFNETIDISNVNNYIKNWEIGNKLCVRLYVEKKDLAIADKLYIRQFFKISEANWGFNFGNINSGWAFSIAPDIGKFERYETSSYSVDGVKGKYGIIAIIMDWDAIDWGTATTKNIGAQTESNLNDIVFDIKEFNKPLESSAKIPDGYIDEDKLSASLKNRLGILSKYELFSLGDSLSAGGVWQKKVADITGCVFDQAKNNKAGAMLSVGGTSSFGDSFDNVLWRAKNLIDQGYIQGQGGNAIVILENVNDSYKVFDNTVRTIVPTNPIEGYSESEFTSDLLNALNDKYNINAVFRLTNTLAGKNLKITSLPTKEGDVTLRVGWAGPGYSNYNVHVVPQESDDLTMKYVLDKILEYAYTGITDVLGEDGISVDFCTGNSNYMPTVEFTDTDNTGMACVVTDNPNAKTSVAKYFVGDSIDDWPNLNKWQTGITYSQGWKSTIELLLRTYPKLHLFVSLFPMHSVTASEYLLPNGTYDTAAYNKVSRMESMRKMQVELGNIAKFYSLPFLDVFAECGIGISNMLTYYNASANVHPKDEGYVKFGETVASQLKRYIV